MIIIIIIIIIASLFDDVTRFGYMEQTDGETAALTSPEDIKTQMKVAIANFQASQHPDLGSVLKQIVMNWAKVSTNLCDTDEHIIATP